MPSQNKGIIVPKTLPRLSEGLNINACRSLVYITPITEGVADPNIVTHNPVEYAVLDEITSNNPVEGTA